MIPILNKYNNNNNNNQILISYNHNNCFKIYNSQLNKLFNPLLYNLKKQIKTYKIIINSI